MDKEKKYVPLDTRVTNLYSLTYKEICQLEQDLTNFIIFYDQKYGDDLHPFFKDFVNVSARKKDLCIQENEYARRFYLNSPCKFVREEVVNGYNLYDISGSGDDWVMDFEKFVYIWSRKDINVEKFDLSSSDWLKVDGDGNEIIEFYLQSDVILEKNQKALDNLPFPRGLIQEILNLPNQKVSVRYCNFLCEWITRKARMIFPPCPSLKEFAIKAVLNTKTVDIETLPQDLVDLIKRVKDIL